MADFQETTYRFGPRPSSGFVLGLRVPQIVGFVAFGVIALAILGSGGFGGLLAALAVMGVAVTVLILPLRGHTLEEWAPVLIRFLIGRLARQHRFRGQLAQTGHVIAIPIGGLDPRPAAEPESTPAELCGLEFLEVELTDFNLARMGAIKDRNAKTFTAVLACQGSAFALMDPEEREARLADYGSVLSSLARDGSPIRRVSWYERTVPGDGDALGSYMLDAMRDDVSLDSQSNELVSYLQLLDRAGDVAQDHELMFAIQIDALRPAARRAITRMGKGDTGALAVLGGEVEQVVRLLEEAAINVTGVLTRRGIAAAVRNGYDPWGRRQRERVVDRGAPHPQDGIAIATAGPVARDEHWSHLASDGALHCTLWVAEWPRVDVRALFLQPLLMSTQTTRTVGMVMELVGPDKAIRHAERASTEAATEQNIRDRVGQRTTRRQQQRESAAVQRERELTEGHAAIRFAAYVTVSVPNSGPGAVDELEAAVSRIEIQTKQASLRLERMWGQQAEALTYTLPLARGLR